MSYPDDMLNRIADYVSLSDIHENHMEIHLKNKQNKTITKIIEIYYQKDPKDKFVLQFFKHNNKPPIKINILHPKDITTKIYKLIIGYAIVFIGLNKTSLEDNIILTYLANTHGYFYHKTLAKVGRNDTNHYGITECLDLLKIID